MIQTRFIQCNTSAECSYNWLESFDRWAREDMCIVAVTGRCRERCTRARLYTRAQVSERLLTLRFWQPSHSVQIPQYGCSPLG